MLTKSVLEINFNPIYFSYLLVVLSFEVFWSQFHILLRILVFWDVTLCHWMRGQLFKCLFSGWRSTLLMKWLQWRHAVSHSFHILLFAHILGKQLQSVLQPGLPYVHLTSRLNIYIQTDFFKVITFWDFGINLAMKN